MMKTFAIVFLFATAGQRLAATATTKVDYCDPALCPQGKTHIDCENWGIFETKCIDPRIIEMTAERKQLLVDAHNEQRNFVAGGGDQRLKAACRMPELQWDDELASFAELSVRKCDPEDESCFNTQRYRFVGEYYVVNLFREGKIPDSEIIRQAAYQPSKDIFQTDIDKFPKEPRMPTNQRTGNMLYDLSKRIGCAAITYAGLEYDRPIAMYLLKCYFSSGPITGQPVYKTCAVPASGCTYGVSCRYPNLCKPCEPIDPNNVWRKEPWAQQ